jgi:hypothetical protein
MPSLCELERITKEITVAEHGTCSAMPTELWYGVILRSIDKQYGKCLSVVLIVIRPVFQTLTKGWSNFPIGGSRTGANGEPRLDIATRALTTWCYSGCGVR